MRLRVGGIGRVCHNKNLANPKNQCKFHHRWLSSSSSSSGTFKYTQGQYNAEDPSIREYFYYIDHNGMLFLDDARMKNFTSCFKEQKFLRFFFRNIRGTERSTTPELVRTLFPYTSYCGKERNYIRVSATPFVMTTLETMEAGNFDYNFTGNVHPFAPSSLYVASDGRLYHEFNLSKHVGFALVKSSVADMISPQFVYEGGKVKGQDEEERVLGRPVAFLVDGNHVELDYRLQTVVEEAIVKHAGSSSSL